MISPQRTQRRGGNPESSRSGYPIGMQVSLPSALIVSLSFYLRVLCVLCGYFLFVAAVVEAAAQDVVPVEGETFAGELVSIDADGYVTLRASAEAGSPGAIRKLRLDELVRWGHPVDARPQTVVVLADGGRLVAAPAWSGGAPVRLEGDTLVVLSGLLSEVRLPRGLVSGVVFAQQNQPRDRERLVEHVLGESREPSPDPSLGGRGKERDAVLLTNGDRLEGKLAELGGGSLTLTTDAGAAKFPLSRVEAVVFGESRQPAAVNHASRFVVGLRDGSMIYASAVRADEKELAIELAGGLTLAGGNVADVVSLQSLNGRFEYLPDMGPADYRHVPYLSIAWPYQRDRNVLGEPLVVSGKRYLKGIGMHSAARLTYRLEEHYKRFDAAVAMDDSAGQRGSVTFGVYVLRDGEWQEGFQSGIVRGGEAPRGVSVDVSGAQGLTLTVDYADRGDELDRADWLDARLVQ